MTNVVVAQVTVNCFNRPLPQQQPESTGQKRGLLVGQTKRGKGTKIRAITDTCGGVVSLCIQSASPHEVTLVEKTIDERFIDDLPEKLIGDKAYDSDGLNEQLKEKGIELIAHHKSNRKKENT